MRSSRRRSFPDIELTPLIDVLFILIIFFVLTTSFVRSQLVIDLPSGKGTSITGSPVVISVDPEGNFAVGNAPVTREEALSLAEESGRNNEDILIAGDTDTSYGTIASLLDDIRARGVDKVSLALGGNTSP